MTIVTSMREAAAARKGALLPSLSSLFFLLFFLQSVLVRASDSVRSLNLVSPSVDTDLLSVA